MHFACLPSWAISEYVYKDGGIRVSDPNRLALIFSTSPLAEWGVSLG